MLNGFFWYLQHFNFSWKLIHINIIVDQLKTYRRPTCLIGDPSETYIPDWKVFSNMNKAYKNANQVFNVNLKLSR